MSTVAELLANLAIGVPITAGLGYGAGKIFPLTEENYRDNPNPSAASAATKMALANGGLSALLGGYASAPLGKKAALLSALLSGGAGALSGAAAGYSYGQGRLNDQARMRALADLKRYEDPLTTEMR